MDERYNNNTFNPRHYEKHLSTVGRKVLDNLIKKWTADRIQSRNILSSSSIHSGPNPPAAAPRWTQEKKVLTFLGKEELRAPHWQQQQQPPLENVIKMSHENDSFHKSFDFELIEKQLPPVPNSDELVKTIETTKDRNIEEANVTIYDTIKLIDPVVKGNKSTNIMFDFYNRPDDEDHDHEAMNPKGACYDEELSTETVTRNVDWNDMFDTELLHTTNAILIIKENAKNDENASNIKFKNNLKDQEYTMNCDQKIKESKENDVNKAKRKSQTKITNTIPKKVKKIKESDAIKNNFRKQKYTKTVKNWLDDVDPNNPVEEDETRGIRDNTVNNKVKNTEIIIDEVKYKPNKKVVQAQLANKDGKMKFGKPKNEVDLNKGSILGITENDQIVKERKSKPKFVASIKSQVPVKDMYYEVVTVDNTNIPEHVDSLRGTENEDLVIVLVYSNGFSQLNKHHTEDTCDPEGFIVNFEDSFYYFKGDNQSFKEVISTLLEHNKVLCYEGKSLLMHFKSKFDLEFSTLNMVDAKIGGSLLDPDNPPENFSDLQKLLSYVPQYTIATESVLQKTAWYAILLKVCCLTLISLLEENELWSVFVDIEMKLVPIIAEMERLGVTVDLVKLKSMEDILLAKMKEVEQECYKAAGKSFQINSAVQIRAILYDELQLDTKSNVKIKETIIQGAKSTSETMLRSLVSVHPLPKLILEYRHLHKAHATFLTGIAQQVKNGVVRPTWVQMAAATGRIASNHPNLQAIPKAPFNLILFPDDGNSGNQSLSIRSVYTSRAGHSLVAADFQHIECRVFAHCAGDTSLLNALEARTDLFRALAAKWSNKPESEVSPVDRERTKRIVYASMYGAGPRKLADILGVGYERTLSIIASFNRTFPSLKSFGRSVVRRCEASGGRLATLCGRARRFPHIGSRDLALRSQAERRAVNYVIQGSAADLCKTAMVPTRARLGARGRLLLQIHDELVWEMPNDRVHAAAAIIKEAMEGCGEHCGMSARLPVAVSVGRTWGDMQPYTPPL